MHSRGQRAASLASVADSGIYMPLDSGIYLIVWPGHSLYRCYVSQIASGYEVFLFFPVRLSTGGAARFLIRVPRADQH